MTEPSSPAQHATPDRPSRDVLDPAPSPDLARALAQMSGLLLSRETVETALELVTTLAATVTVGTLGAAVTVIDEDGRRSRAATDRATEQADVLQYEFDEGPCLTAWRTAELVRIDDTTTDRRWPRWNEAVSQLGVRSVLSVPLLVKDEDPIGAMKVYCTRPMNYGPQDERVLRLLASQAAILLANTRSLQEARRLSRRLTEALAGRDAIARATGVLLARGAATPQDAFATLAASARRSDRSVEDVAHALLAAVITRNSGDATG